MSDIPNAYKLQCSTPHNQNSRQTAAVSSLSRPFFPYLLVYPVKVEARSKVDVVVGTIIVRASRGVVRAFDLAVVQRDAEVAVVVIAAVGLDIGFQSWEA